MKSRPRGRTAHTEFALGPPAGRARGAGASGAQRLRFPGARGLRSARALKSSSAVIGLARCRSAPAARLGLQCSAQRVGGQHEDRRGRQRRGCASCSRIARVARQAVHHRHLHVHQHRRRSRRAAKASTAASAVLRPMCSSTPNCGQDQLRRPCGSSDGRRPAARASASRRGRRLGARAGAVGLLRRFAPGPPRPPPASAG